MVIEMVNLFYQMIAYLKVKNSEQERIRQRKLKEQRELERGKIVSGEIHNMQR
jgi:hypothetical protein